MFHEVPDIDDWESDDILVDPSTKIAKLTIPSSIFFSDVGTVEKIFLLLAELVSFYFLRFVWNNFGGLSLQGTFVTCQQIDFIIASFFRTAETR